MKKFYSFLLAAVTIASSAIAGNRVPELSIKTLDLEVKETYNAVKALPQISSKKAPAAHAEAATQYPQDLEGVNAMISLQLIEEEVAYNVKSGVNFSDGVEVSETSTSTYVYTMSNPFADIYEGIETYPLEVYYYPEYGLLVLPGNQTYISVNGYDFLLWTTFQEDPEYIYRPNYFFEYNTENGEFVLVNPMPIQLEEDADSVERTITGFYLGTITDNGVSAINEIGANIAITFVDASGTMNLVMEMADGDEEISSSVFAKVVENTLTVYNFGGGLCDVPMTIDVAAKTLTANKVQVPGITTYKAYLSAADANGNNAAGNRKYILTSTYNVVDGKTNISVPTWNAFFYEMSSGDLAYFYPMVNTTIVFDFDIDAAASAGINNIAADAIDVNAPVEYYNLQGIRVATPEAGQLLIKRQGNQASKVVIR